MTLMKNIFFLFPLTINSYCLIMYYWLLFKSVWNIIAIILYFYNSIIFDCLNLIQLKRLQKVESKRCFRHEDDHLEFRYLNHNLVWLLPALFPDMKFVRYQEDDFRSNLRHRVMGDNTRNSHIFVVTVEIKLVTKYILFVWS